MTKLGHKCMALVYEDRALAWQGNLYKYDSRLWRSGVRRLVRRFRMLAQWERQRSL